MQLQTLDGKLHLLSDADYTEVVREKKSLMPPLTGSAEERRNVIAYLSSLGGIAIGPLQSADDSANQTPWAKNDWPTYNGVLGGNRHSGLEQINATNASRCSLSIRSP